MSPPLDIGIDRSGAVAGVLEPQPIATTATSDNRDTRIRSS
jgi:hypothetical protein